MFLFHSEPYICRTNLKISVPFVIHAKDQKLTTTIYPIFSMQPLVLPRPFNESPSDKNLFDRHKNCPQFDPLKVLHLEDILTTYSGVVIKDFKIIPDCYHAEEGKIIEKEARKIALFHYLTRWRETLEDETYILAHTLWCPGYYAWVHNTLPRLARVEALLGTHTLLLPESCQRYEASLAPFGIKKIKYLRKNKIYKIKHLILPSAVGSGASLGREVLEKLRNNYHEWAAQEVKMPTGKHADRIFISRLDSKSRRIINEQRIIEMVKNYGFTVIYLENMDFWEQVWTFRNASIVVGTHGAGLSNTLFMPSGAAVLEFLPIQAAKGNFRSMYYHITSALGLRYAYQFCKVYGQEEHPNTSPYNLDIEIDASVLEENLKQLLE